MENEFQPRPSQTYSGGIFSRKITETNHPTLIFNGNPVHQVALQKHLGMFLGCTLNLEGHLKTIVNKIKKTIGLLLSITDWNHFNKMWC